VGLLVVVLALLGVAPVSLVAPGWPVSVLVGGGVLFVSATVAVSFMPLGGAGSGFLANGAPKVVPGL
jgi:hypothetical protein